MKRTWCAALVMFAACGSDKSTPAPTETLPTEVQVGVPSEVAPPTTDEKEPEEAKKPKHRLGRWDPPQNMPHLASTEPVLRRKIDELVATMMDVRAGKKSLRARNDLVRLGKPAFPRILGAMAKIRDTITDVDDGEKRLMESPLRLADEALCWMGGFPRLKSDLDVAVRYALSEEVEFSASRVRWLLKRMAKFRPRIRLHYKMWTLSLKYMHEMPGPDATLFRAAREKITGQLARFLDGKATASSTLAALFDIDDLTLEFLGKPLWKLVEKIPERMKKERESRNKLGSLLVRELNNEDLRLRTLARDCLRVLYDKTVYYDTNAPPARRVEKMRRWREVIDAADK